MIKDKILLVFALLMSCFVVAFSVLLGSIFIMFILSIVIERVYTKNNVWVVTYEN